MKKEMIARAIFAATKQHSVTFYWAMPVATLKVMYAELVGAPVEVEVVVAEPVTAAIVTDEELETELNADADADADAEVDIECDDADFYYDGFQTDAEELGSLFNFNTVD